MSEDIVEMGIKSNILKESRISNKILCFYIIFVLIISILPFAGLSEKPNISSNTQGDVSTSDDYVNFTVNITSSENVSSFIDWDRSLVGYWNFENFKSHNSIFDNSTWNNDAIMVDRSADNITFGRYGNGTYFNGSGGGELHINHSDEFNLSNELTLELWFKEFETTFNLSFHNTSGNYHDFGYAVDQTSDGGYIFTGEGSYNPSNTPPLGSGDIFISKHDSCGNIQDTTFYATEYEDIAKDIIETNDGKYAVTGWVGTGDKDLFVGEYIFYNNNKTISRTQSPYINGGAYQEKGYSIKQANDGNYIVAGQTNSFGNPNNPDMWLLKLNRSNLYDEPLINNTFGSPTLSELAYSVCVTNDGNYTLAGTRDISATDIVKIKANNTNGNSWDQNVIWCKNDTGWSDADQPWDIIETEPDHGFLVVGFSNWSAGDKQDLFIQKTDSTGTNIWIKSYDKGTIVTGFNYSCGFSANQTRDRGYIVTGYVGMDNGDFYDSSRNIILIKLDSDLDEEWNRTLDLPGQQEGHSIKQTTDGGYIVAGFTNNSDGNWMEFWLLKTNITGYLTESNNNQSLNKTLIGKGRDSYQLELCNGTIIGYINDKAVVSNNSFDLYDLSQNWNHLVLTYNKNAIDDKTKLYLNKELVGSNSTFSDFISNNTKNLTIGRNFSGIIDEVRVWNRELSFEEICASYNISSGSYSKNFTNLADGEYSYYTYAINENGTENKTQEYNITVDTTPPTATVDDFGNEYATSDFYVFWNGTDTGSGIRNYTVEYKNGSSGNWEPWLINVSYTKTQALWDLDNTTDGMMVYFHVLAVDNASNVGSFSSEKGIMVNPNLTTVYVDDDFSISTDNWNITCYDTIQEGIDNVLPNGTVYVSNGTYYENLVINKGMSLIGYSQTNVILETQNIAIEMYANNTLIQNMTITNTSGYPLNIGTKIHNYVNNISLDSITIRNVTGQILNISILIGDYSDNISITNNDISNSGKGIALNYHINNSNVTNNSIYDCKYSIFIDNSSYNNIESNNIYNCEYGIYFCYNSNNNTIFSNTITNSTNFGMYLNNSPNNLIYNNYFNNSNNTYDNDINNWNTTITPGDNKIGGQYLGGNYWNDYSGADTNHDGLGDTFTPYNSSNNITTGGDHHPLVISPSVLTKSPTGTSVSVSSNIVVTFNKSMNQTTTENNFSVSHSVDGSYSWDNETLTFNPDSNLDYSKKYTVTIGWNATDTFGNVMIENHSWNFTTRSDPSPGGPGPTPQEPDDEDENETSDDTNDTIGPTITIITPKNGEITFDKKPKIKASYSDENGINTSSIIFKLDGKIKSPTIFSSYLTYLPSSDLSSGTHNIYLKVSDSLGNSNSKSWSFKINHSIYHESQNITNTTIGNKTIINPVNKTITIVDGIEITSNKNYQNLEIEITDLGENISLKIEKPEPPELNKSYILYRYLDFRIKSNDTYITEDIGNIKINFTVNSTWLKNHEINISNVTMLRYHNNSWVKLYTNFIKKIDDKILFQCSTTGFSTFAVVGSKIVKKEDTLERPEEIPWIIIIGFVIAAIAILILILFKTGYIYIERE